MPIPRLMLHLLLNQVKNTGPLSETEVRESCRWLEGVWREGGGREGGVCRGKGLAVV